MLSKFLWHENANLIFNDSQLTLLTHISLQLRIYNIVKREGDRRHLGLLLWIRHCLRKCTPKTVRTRIKLQNSSLCIYCLWWTTTSCCWNLLTKTNSHEFIIEFQVWCVNLTTNRSSKKKNRNNLPKDVWKTYTSIHSGAKRIKKKNNIHRFIYYCIPLSTVVANSYVSSSWEVFAVEIIIYIYIKNKYCF